jgi:hypothetical protein
MIMSAEQESPDDLRLPDELAAYEARLASSPLASSALNRDELLYRAGWAAAEAQLTRRVTTTVAAPRGLGRRAVAAWSAASAAVAASLAVAITWAVAARPMSEPFLAEAPRASVETRESAVAVTRPAAMSTTPRVTNSLSLARVEMMINRESRLQRGVTPASLWAASRGQRVGRWDEPILVSGESLASAPTIGVDRTTARDLLDEMLPRNGRSSAEEVASPSTRILEFFRPLTAGGDAI